METVSKKCGNAAERLQHLSRFLFTTYQCYLSAALFNGSHHRLDF
jgi:hypothetical protein